MTANREQAALWNEASGRTWVELQAILDGMLAPFGELLVEAGFPGEGGRALDIGCGAGATTLAMARQLGPVGQILGVDISAPLVAAARARAAADGVANATFVAADAQTHRFEAASVDAILSRFGVMFFDDPPAAFANIRGAARPGARLAFVAWRGPAENPFLAASSRAAKQLFPELPSPAPDAPGMYAFADGERVRRILDASGWTDVEVRPVDLPCSIAAAHLATYGTRLGPLGTALRNADDATRARAAEVVAGAYEPFVQGGEAHYTAAGWLVLARAPA